MIMTATKGDALKSVIFPSSHKLVLLWYVCSLQCGNGTFLKMTCLFIHVMSVQKSFCKDLQFRSNFSC